MKLFKVQQPNRDPQILPVTRELTPYELWQVERFGNIVKEAIVLPNGSIETSNPEELERFERWCSLKQEQELIERSH